jgi:hypothetical protein
MKKVSRRVPKRALAGAYALCTVRIISSISRQSTNLCGAFLILRQWSCGNPRVLVCMIVIATPPHNETAVIHQ